MGTSLERWGASERGPGRYDVTLRLADGTTWRCTAVTLVDADASTRIATERYDYLDGSVAVVGSTAVYVGPLRYSENGTVHIGGDAFDRMEF